ncbi:cysteine-rich repeat secretory protein 15 isoform X2 [Vigna radiata var. radiata]|uniref:Cysteine-rich repeat secretory protein 15 isoform X2 n=1 Tax=Vigna radiata var. radiata TaxID=3916 RepID=A0A1S3TFJ3_VIGRR|nr:cysteine-rich repeat secretory protein 15 isoform X2 [Vigna radiata var. radiata]
MSRTLEAESGYRIIFIWRLSYLLILFSSVHGYPSRDHMFIYAVCSEEKYQPNAPFEGNLNSFMSSVVSSSSEVIYNSFAIGNGSSTPQEGNVYGLYQCRGDLHPIECSKCVERSVNEIGKLDTSLRYKKCSKGVTSDVEFFRRRDDVLADLQTANGFRVSSSGLVEGFAQCLGDLTLSDCSSCLADAVGKLKTLCGSAAAAHVFLGQCYARYWASGYYHESDSSDDDQVGKSVAIIVGVFGGLAVLVVLLSICKKAAGK